MAFNFARFPPFEDGLCDYSIYPYYPLKHWTFHYRKLRVVEHFYPMLVNHLSKRIRSEDILKNQMTVLIPANLTTQSDKGFRDFFTLLKAVLDDELYTHNQPWVSICIYDIYKEYIIYIHI